MARWVAILFMANGLVIAFVGDIIDDNVAPTNYVGDIVTFIGAALAGMGFNEWTESGNG